MQHKQTQKNDQEIKEFADKSANDLANELAQEVFTQAYQKFSDIFRQKEQLIASLKQTIEKLNDDNSFLQKENSNLKKEYHEVNQRFMRAISELDKRQKSEDGKMNSKTSGFADGFRQLRDQNFQNTAKKILEYLSQLELKNVKSKNSRGKASIQAILARHILLEDNLLDNITIINNIRTFLGIPENSAGWSEIQEELQELIEKSHQLVESIRNTDPPGKLVGDSFNPQQHEVIPGIEAHGRVSSIIFPSYQMKDTVLVKALVLTEPYQPDKEQNTHEQKPSTETLQSEQDTNEQKSSTEELPQQEQDTDEKKPSTKPLQSEQDAEEQIPPPYPALQNQPDQLV